MIRKSGKKNTEIDLFEWTKNTKTSVPHVNGQQSVPSAEKDFNNQMERRVGYIPVSQPYLPGTFCYCLMGSEKSACGGIRGIYI